MVPRIEVHSSLSDGKGCGSNSSRPPQQHSTSPSLSEGPPELCGKMHLCMFVRAEDGVCVERNGPCQAISFVQNKTVLMYIW